MWKIQILENYSVRLTFMDLVGFFGKNERALELDEFTRF